MQQRLTTQILLKLALHASASKARHQEDQLHQMNDRLKSNAGDVSVRNPLIGGPLYAGSGAELLLSLANRFSRLATDAN